MKLYQQLNRNHLAIAYCNTNTHTPTHTQIAAGHVSVGQTDQEIITVSPNGIVRTFFEKHL